MAAEADLYARANTIPGRRGGGQADAINLVAVSIGGRTRVTTIPESVIRVRLNPGAHRVWLEWEGRSIEHLVSGRAGQLQFLELVGSVWSWGINYRWEEGTPESSWPRALAFKVIADIDLRD
jgi:hypothetical protein